jgi:internalin A
MAERETAAAAAATGQAVMDLKLINQNLTRVPEEVLSYTFLHFLDLSNNALSCLPEGLADLKFLYVGLSGGCAQVVCVCVCAIVDPFFSSASLRVELNISRNQLTLFPKRIDNLRSLVKLDASQNAFQDVPEELGSLPRLEVRPKHSPTPPP